MTAAGPDPYAETVRLLPADTFTQQTRDEWVAVVAEEITGAVLDKTEGFIYAIDYGEATQLAETAVDALLAHLATQLAHLAAQQTRAVLYEIAARTLFEIDGGTWPDDCTFPEDYRKDSEAVVDALLAHIAAQRPRPMGGAHNG